MSLIKKAKKYLRNPWKIPYTLTNLGFGFLFTDKCYIKNTYRASFGVAIDLKDP